MDKHGRLETILGGCLGEGFETNIALADGDRSLTYNELSNKVDEVVKGLSGYAGVAISIEFGRSINQVIGCLAVLKSGNIPVPLDPATSEEIRVEKRRAANVYFRLGEDLGLLPLSSEIKFFDKLDEEFPACILFTSGSTGKPKGVKVGADSLGNYVKEVVKLYGLTSNDVVLQYSSPEFDGYFDELFSTLAVGACLYIRNKSFPASGLGFFRCCNDAGVTVLELPTAAWREIGSILFANPSIRTPSLRLVVTGGEAADEYTRDIWFESFSSNKLRQINAYGPTEAAISVCFHEMIRNEPVTIGMPIGGVYLQFVDENGAVVQDNCSGEVWIGGVALADGYLNEKMTEEKFVIDANGTRWYKTGDRGRRDDAGNIHYEGRIDRQVKVRGGYRVELGEIQSVVGAVLPKIWAEVVAPKTPYGRVPVVFLLASVSDVSIQALYKQMKVLLPTYAQPAEIKLIETFPMTSRGKVDFLKLEDMAASAIAESDNSSDSISVFSKIQTALSPFLRGDVVLKETEFLSLGLDSLDIVQFLMILSDAVGCDITSDDLLEYTSVADLETYINSLKDNNINLVHYPKGERQLVKMRSSGKSLWCFFPPLSGAATRYVKMPALLPAEDAVWAMETPASLVEQGFIQAAKVLACTIFENGVGSFNNIIFSGYSLGAAFAYQAMESLINDYGILPSKCSLSLLDPIPPLSPRVPLAEVARIFISIGFRCDGEYEQYLDFNGHPDFDKITDGAIKAGLLTNTTSSEVVRNAWAVYISNSQLSEQFNPEPLDILVYALFTTGIEKDVASKIEVGDPPSVWHSVLASKNVSYIDTHHFALMQQDNEPLVSQWLRASIPSRN